MSKSAKKLLLILLVAAILFFVAAGLLFSLGGFSVTGSSSYLFGLGSGVLISLYSFIIVDHIFDD